MRRDPAALPRAHVHLHLDGALRPGTLAELVAAAGIEAPPPSDTGGFGLIVAANRARGPAEALALARRAVAGTRKGVVGFDGAAPPA